MLFRKQNPLLNPAEQERVVACIREAEARTTGEIRVFMESKCSYMNAMDRAVELFHELEMTKTERRNATLIYLATEDRQFALAGDKEIYEKAGGEAFWKQAADELQAYLRRGAAADGLCRCIVLLGDALATHFPYDPAITKNELPDEIVFGK